MEEEKHTKTWWEETNSCIHCNTKLTKDNQQEDLLICKTCADKNVKATELGDKKRKFFSSIWGIISFILGLLLVLYLILGMLSGGLSVMQMK